ncbi:MAG: uroporphyrinogen decarboxylase family protein [Acidobacteriota bacterium]
MEQETMSSEERVMAAISLEKPDRVPIAFSLDTAPAARLLGLKSWEVAAQGFDAQLDTVLRAFDELGGWDGLTPIIPPDIYSLIGIKARFPSEDSPENQVLEGEVWGADEYERLLELGYTRFVNEHLAFRVSEMTTPEEIAELGERSLVLLMRFINEVKKRGAVPYGAPLNVHPFFWMSLTRSMVRFTEDLYYRPDCVERALKAIVPQWIELTVALSKLMDSKIVHLAEERAGSFFYPLRVFERFWWPYTLQIVDALWSEGIVTLFHLDQCWDKNIPYFKQLPKRSAIVDLDGTTDIFAAKEVLRGHLCIGGDVHPTLLSLGKPEEVAAYCRRLIEEVGDHGGLILNVGCSVPYQTKPENLRAMIETGKTYELSRK